MGSGSLARDRAGPPALGTQIFAAGLPEEPLSASSKTCSILRLVCVIPRLTVSFLAKVFFEMTVGTFLVVQWLRLHVSNAGGVEGLNPGWGTKILHAGWCGQKEENVFTYN